MMKNIFATFLLFSIAINASQQPQSSSPKQGISPDWSQVRSALEKCQNQPLCPIEEARATGLLPATRDYTSDDDFNNGDIVAKFLEDQEINNPIVAMFLEDQIINNSYDNEKSAIR